MKNFMHLIIGFAIGLTSFILGTLAAGCDARGELADTNAKKDNAYTKEDNSFLTNLSVTEEFRVSDYANIIVIKDIKNKTICYMLNTKAISCIKTL